MSAQVDWNRVKALFAQALDIPEDRRESWTAEQCGNDAEMRAELLSLLAAQCAPRTDFLSQGHRLILPALSARMEGSSGPEIGARIGPYRLLREIGAGGMGRVFLAERVDGQFNQQVALKLIRGEFTGPELLRRFLRERDTLSRMAHANIAALHDGGVAENDAPYFTMEFIEGAPITHWCDERKLDLRARARLMLKVCGAVQYAHRNLIVHRDIKPSNILITADGEPKLLDFGIAKPLAANTQSEEHTGTQLRPMTLEYAAPEQVLGEPVTTATDVYALGVLLYRLFCGRIPYRRVALGQSGWSKAILEEMPEAMARALDRSGASSDPSDAAALAATRSVSAPKLRQALHGDPERIVQRALAKSPDARYPTADALADDLHAFIDARALSGGTRTYRLRKFARRHWLPLAASSAIALVVLVSAIALAWDASRIARQAKTTAAVKDFLMGLFTAVDPHEAKGRDLSARELLERGKREIDDKPPEDPIVKAELQAVLGRIDYQLGLYAEASELQRQAAVAFASDKAHPLQQAEAELDRSETLAETQDWKLSEDLVATITTHLAAVAEPPARDRVRLLVAQARIAFIKRKSDDMRRYAEAALALARQAHVDDNLLIVALLIAGNAASADSPGRALDAAEAEYREGLALAVRARGNDSLQVASLRGNLSQVLAKHSRYIEALSEQQQGLTIESKVLGPEHPHTLSSIAVIGLYNYHLGHYRDARDLLQQAATAQRRTLGADSPVVAGTSLNLGLALIEVPDLDGAERAFSESESIWEAKFGPDYLGVQVALGNLGYVHLLQGQLDRAEKDLTQVVQHNEKVGVANDETTDWRLGELARRRGNVAEAIRWNQRAVDAARKNNGESSRYTAVAHHYCALALRDGGDATGAEREWRAALASFAGYIPDADHPLAATTRLELASLLASRPTQRAEAIRLADAAVDIRSRFLGNDDKRTLVARILATQIRDHVVATPTTAHP